MSNKKLLREFLIDLGALSQTYPDKDLWSNPENPEEAMEVALSQVEEAPRKSSFLSPERTKLLRGDMKHHYGDGPLFQIGHGKSSEEIKQKFKRKKERKETVRDGRTVETVFDVLWYGDYERDNYRETYEYVGSPKRHLYRFIDDKTFDEAVYGFKFIDDDVANEYRDTKNFVDKNDVGLQLYNLTANTNVDELWFEEPDDSHFWTLGISGTYEDIEGEETEYEIALVGPKEEDFLMPEEKALKEARSDFEDNYRNWKIDESAAGIEEELNKERNK